MTVSIAYKISSLPFVGDDDYTFAGFHVEMIVDTIRYDTILRFDLLLDIASLGRSIQTSTQQVQESFLR